MHDYLVRYYHKSHSGEEEHDTLDILRTDDPDEIRLVAAMYAETLASKYSCKMRRWGLDSWRVWEPGEDGFDIWVRITRETA